MLAEDLAGDGAGGDAGRGLARGGAAAAAIVADAVFQIIGEVGMARPVEILDLAIVLRALVLVADHQAHRRARGQALEHARQDLHLVRLAPLGGEFGGAGLAPVEPVLDVGLG